MATTKCHGCGARTISYTGWCQTCKSKRHHARKRIAGEGLVVDQAGGSWWIWTKDGEVLVSGKRTQAAAITALAMGGTEDETDEPAEPAEQGAPRANAAPELTRAEEKLVAEAAMSSRGNVSVTSGLHQRQRGHVLIPFGAKACAAAQSLITKGYATHVSHTEERDRGAHYSVHTISVHRSVIAYLEALKKARDVGAVPTPNASRSAERFTVRKMVSGRTGVAKFYVYDTVSKGRVTVHAHLLRDSAAAEADSLNIGDMVRPHAEDPRPYDERRAEAEESYMARRRRI
jgi:hypothetical protein